MKAWTLSLLLLITIGLGTYIYYGIQKPAEEAAERLPVEDRVIPYDLELLEEIQIRIPGQKKIVLSSQDSRWLIKEPYQDLPSQTRLESLFHTLSHWKKEKSILSPQEFSKEQLAKYKLGGAESLGLQLKFKSEDKALVFHLGGPNPSRSGNYVWNENSSEVLLASNQLDSLRTETPDGFREKRLITVDNEDIAEVRIQNAQGNMKFARNSSGEWEMLEPSPLPIDQVFTKNQLNKLTLMRANEFLEKSPTELKKPEIRILVGFKENVKDKRTDESDPRPSGTELLLARQKKSKKIEGDEGDQFEYFASSEKVGAVRISRFHYDNFTKSYREFVKKSFDDFSLSQVKNIKMTAKDENFELVHQDGKFQWEEKEPVVQEALNKAINELRNLKASEFLALEAAPQNVDLRLNLIVEGIGERHYAFKTEGNTQYLWLRTGDQDLKYSLRQDSFDSSLWKKSSLKSAPKASSEEELHETSEEQRN